ncbi:MAG: SLBB domain-containing protein [Desulfobacteraceae bacterium]|nr:SLBB domain-containing protein [Desulfobacteraceae bacterium]
MAESRIILKNCEVIDPADIGTYIEKDGFKALEKARTSMSQESVIDEVKSSGLRGRGGAGFPCGVKWELAANADGSEKYLICNADEGEMGTFKDRYLLEYDPFSLIEGIAIAAYAIGAVKAYIYLRGEYRYLLSTIRGAIGQAVEKGYLDGLDIVLQEGAGAYICGEETALMNSLEGKRGEARFKPPFPPVSGLFEKPTIINNVETLAAIPRIILNGAEWFSNIGTEKSKGTKIFSVSGDVSRPGIYELPMGSSLKQLVVDLAGATDIKIIQVGGAAGRLLPYNWLDTALSFETVLGAGAVTVFDSSRDMIDVVFKTIEFLAEESCGLCTPCREGSQVLFEILERLRNGEGEQQDTDVLEDVANTMAEASLCGLGQGTAVPVLDSLNFFKQDYKNRIEQSLYIKSLLG